MAISRFDKPTTRQLGQQVEGLLQDFCKKHGLKVAYSGGKFTPDKFDMSITLHVLTESTSTSPLAVSGEPRGFGIAAQAIGLPSDCYGKKAMIQGLLYTINDIQLNRPKYPVSVTRSDGKRFKMTAATIKNGLLT